VASVGEEKSVLAGAATRIEDGADDLVSYVDQCFLWPANIPRWLTGVSGFKVGAVGDGHV
jgi:hypothetical protein